MPFILLIMMLMTGAVINDYNGLEVVLTALSFSLYGLPFIIYIKAA